LYFKVKYPELLLTTLVLSLDIVNPIAWKFLTQDFHNSIFTKNIGKKPGKFTSDGIKSHQSDFVYGLKSGVLLNMNHSQIHLCLTNESSTYFNLYGQTKKKLLEKIKIGEKGSFYIKDYNNWFVFELSKSELDFMKEFFKEFDKKIEIELKISLNQKKKETIIEQKRLKDLKESQTNVLSELDKDGNGIIDVIEGGDDFMKLFRKHQSVIKEFDKEYINHLVKISNYLKTKRNNIQEIFLEIRKTKNQSQLEENVGLLKNQIHTYEVVLFHSLSLITSIVEDDLITVNEIYEEFDKLKMFKTDHEKEVSQKLSDIGDGLSTLMYSINSMERNIVSGLNTLSYVTEEGFSDLNSSLSRELQSIDSSIQSNNLLTGIQTYQLYKINKQTKGLIG